MSDVDRVADEIYGLTPGEFTAGRDARVREVRRSGDRAAAAAIATLRRPTASAWLANLLARRRPEQLAALIDFGAGMRRAQAELATDELRRLSHQRRDVVAALAAEARQLAGDLGQAVSVEAGRELESTLEAALADAAAGEAVRSGRLTTALFYSGLGPVDLAGAVAASPGSAVTGDDPTGGMAGGPGGPSGPGGEDRGGPGGPVGEDRGGPGGPVGEDPASVSRRRPEVEAAERALREARAAAVAAQRDAAEQEGRLVEARHRLQERRTRTAELARQLDQLQGELDRHGTEERRAAVEAADAEADREHAEQALRIAEDRVAQAGHDLDHRRATDPAAG